MKLSNNQQIFSGAILGIVLGIFLTVLGPDSSLGQSLLYICTLIGKIFVGLLKMILIPLVFTSIAVGIANLRRHAQMNTVWKSTLVYYFSTTGLAVGLGLIVVNVFKPGKGLSIDMFAQAASTSNIQNLTLAQFIENLISNLFINPVQAMANGQVLGTIIFALFLGIALVKRGEDTPKTISFLNEAFTLIMTMVQWIMKILPLGIMALLAKLIATQDHAVLGVMIKFIAVVIGATLFHGFVVLPTVLYLFTGRTPFKFYTQIREALITAFSTSSSAATLPITHRCATENLKVDKDVAGFVLPLGATINMDGTALYEAIAALFIANLSGIDLNIAQQLTVFLMSILASVGAPGIPSAGMVTMVMVLQSVGLPVEAIAILIPIDRPLDAIRTAVNVNGDLIGSAVIHERLHFPQKA